MPALLYELILKLQGTYQEAGEEEDSAHILSWETEGSKIYMLQGTALDPPTVKAEVIVAQCAKSDEVRLHVLSHMNYLYQCYNILNTKLTKTCTSNPNHCW